MPSPASQIWKPSTIPGLYVYTPNSIYYSRYTLNGKRRWKSLQTSTFTVASIKHRKLMDDVAKARLDAPAKPTASQNQPRTMGDLESLLLARVDTSQRSIGTKTNWGVWLRRLASVWPNGETAFRAALPSQITLDSILRIRAQLGQTTFRIAHTKRTRKGYAPAVINQTLTALKTLLQLAKEHHLIFTSPFDDTAAFGAQIWLAKNTRKPELPSRFDMERVFAAMGTAWKTAGFDKGRVDFLKDQALDAAEHARFLPFSGGRLKECNGAMWEHVGAESIMLYGTKSKSSTRPVPIVPAMAELLREIRARRVAMGVPLRGPILRVKGCLGALRRACKRVGVPILTHHHLRHYFVTVCIESGVDIPTISRWVGHADGGALLMKTYAHLRDQHSARMGAQVSFGAETISPRTSAAQ